MATSNDRCPHGYLIEEDCSICDGAESVRYQQLLLKDHPTRTRTSSESSEPGKSAPPIELIGRFGEYFASQWLEKGGFEIRQLWEMNLKLRPVPGLEALQMEMEEFVPEDERRRRLTQSYETRIPMLEARLEEAEGHRNLSQKVKNWIAFEREHLQLMKQALVDIEKGKPLESITEYPTEYPARLMRYHQWRIYKEVKTDSNAHDFLGTKVDDFVKYLDECYEISRAELGGTMLPDIVARKGSEFFIVEVKANEAKLAPLQRRALDLAAKYGFKTKVVRVRFEARCEEEAIWKRPPK